MKLMLLDWYQHLPEHISPIALSIGSFSIRWYSVMYLFAFTIAYFLLAHRIKKNENTWGINREQLLDILIYLIAGLLLGARLGYVLFYNLPYYINHPLEIFLPIQATGYGLQFTGISGMSYHGGLIGVIIAGAIYCWKNKLSFLVLSDFIVPVVPAGFFFGRIGNFLNGELYGRATEKFWGMYFPSDPLGLLRYPSQLVEAFFEGIVLFAILWLLRNKSKFHGQLLMIYLLGYGLIRFSVEFFREPDAQIGLIAGVFSLGQVLSLCMIVIAALSYFIVSRRKKEYNK